MASIFLLAIIGVCVYFVIFKKDKIGHMMIIVVGLFFVYNFLHENLFGPMGIDLKAETKQSPLENGTDTLSVSASFKYTWTEPITGMEFVMVPGGCYQIGWGAVSLFFMKDFSPVHEVCLDGFWIGKYEVTKPQWKAVMGNDNLFAKECVKNCPVSGVSWNDAKQFVGRINGRSNGKNYRLPTEAEWEYACRSGRKNEEFSGGYNVDLVAWYGSNSNKTTHSVGTKKPNQLGIYEYMI